ncbi:5' nucleotidase, NT5C type [Paenibacillus nasutitermitis]|uniref:Nucleotidase n=1 Tax=Paenibacillus nasutitermitis TaxID=1652958 RepID=A0A916YSH8_9BACL|nr:HAD family acid phosphatase [Paenibacillus nasutitermitis]GGD57809.1 putative nucleotidase [Paenibacillus nasutitermitis]
MRFGFDIDDTLINLREHAFHVYNRKLNKQIGLEQFQDLNKIPIHDLFGMTMEEGKLMWNTHREEIYYSACPPFPNAIEVLHELVRRGHEVYYITARTSEHCERTSSWLVQAGFPVKEGHFFCGMSDTQKVHIIQELELDYYFDDKPAVLETLTELSINIYAKDSSYNRHIDIPRIGCWNELIRLLPE